MHFDQMLMYGSVTCAACFGLAWVVNSLFSPPRIILAIVVGVPVGLAGAAYMLFAKAL